MSEKQIRNVSASIRQRLLNKARADQRQFAELIQYYAMERIMFRRGSESRMDSSWSMAAYQTQLRFAQPQAKHSK